MPRVIAQAVHEETPLRNFELTKAVAVALGESAGYLGAWHDNLAADGVTVVSRDCGLYQINIPASEIGTAVEDQLRTESKDPAVYEPVFQTNVSEMFALYTESWTRDGKPDIRRWEAWVAYTSGWVPFQQQWVWRQDAGMPVGPWVATGRYLARAICGQMNYHAVISRDWSLAKALYYAQFYAVHFGLVDVSFAISPTYGIVVPVYAAAPAAPPADGVGPRPVPNSGV
jgi:hypothetical protein